MARREGASEVSIDPVNPRLKSAMEDIKDVLKKYDIAGSVLLCSGEQSEYLSWIAAPYGPSWSCLYKDKAGIRFRAKAKTGGFHERFKYTSTLKAINTMRNASLFLFNFADKICQMTDHLTEDGGDSAHIAHRD